MTALRPSRHPIRSALIDLPALTVADCFLRVAFRLYAFAGEIESAKAVNRAAREIAVVNAVERRGRR